MDYLVWAQRRHWQVITELEHLPLAVLGVAPTLLCRWEGRHGSHQRASARAGLCARRCSR